MTIRRTHIAWRSAWRLIPSRFPTVDLFQAIAPPEDFEALANVESLTNDRLRDERGEIQLVPAKDRISGPGTSVLMAPFTHLNPEGSRFSDGTYGIFYASRSLDTAIAETRYERSCFMRATMQPALEFDMRVYSLEVDGLFHDVRHLCKSQPELSDLNNYGATQQLTRELRENGSDGVLYQSLHEPHGECIGALRPAVLSRCRERMHLCYLWNGHDVVDVFEKRQLRP